MNNTHTHLHECTQIIMIMQTDPIRHIHKHTHTPCTLQITITIVSNKLVNINIPSVVQYNSIIIKIPNSTHECINVFLCNRLFAVYLTLHCKHGHGKVKIIMLT